MNFRAIAVILFLLLIMPAQPLLGKGLKSGILVWFYSLEVKDNKESGKIFSFKQTAGATYPPNIINRIVPLSPQSKISKDKDDNWYLDFAYSKMRISHERPLFLGQIVDLSTSDTIYDFISSKHNVPVGKLKYSSSLDIYLQDRADLQISNPKIIQIKDRLVSQNPKILDYIIAVDKFVHDQLDYNKPLRPNTAVDLLSMNNGWCGEYSKLKQSLLRSAGIATRDVYASRTGENGPSVDDTGSSKAHAWLQVYVPDAGWISIPSTRKLYKHYQFVRFRGGYYIRALDLYKHEKEVQQKRYTYRALKRAGGVRGNGMFFEISPVHLHGIQSVTSKILDYKTTPSVDILSEIESLPKAVQPLLYWFLISVPDDRLNVMAAELFLEALESQPTLDLHMFYVVSPKLLKMRIDRMLKDFLQ